MARRKPKLDGDVKRRLMIVDYRTRLTDGVKKTLFDLSNGVFLWQINKNAVSVLLKDKKGRSFLDRGGEIRYNTDSYGAYESLENKELFAVFPSTEKRC